MLRKPDDQTVNYSTVAIIGDPGSYKTLLASTFPHAYFLDVDGGAAHTGCYRLGDIPKSKAGYLQVKREIAALGKLTPGPDGLLTHTVDGTTFKVGTVVLDTLDETQILAGFSAANSDQRKYYRALLACIRDDIIYPMRNINSHVVVIAHTKTWGVDNEQKAAGQTTKRTLALEGSVRNALPGWFDVILHITNERGGKRMMITQPTFKGQWEFLAKDRYHVFGGSQYEVKMVGNRPDESLAKLILERTSGGIKPVQVSGERARVKADLLARAREKHLIGVKPTDDEIRLLKTVLGDVYVELETLTEGFDVHLERGVELIDNYKEEE